MKVSIGKKVFEDVIGIGITAENKWFDINIKNDGEDLDKLKASIEKTNKVIKVTYDEEFTETYNQYTVVHSVEHDPTDNTIWIVMVTEDYEEV